MLIEKRLNNIETTIADLFGMFDLYNRDLAIIRNFLLTKFLEDSEALEKLAQQIGINLDDALSARH